MRICVVGCGAIGSLFAAHLGQVDDVEVYAYDVWQDHVDAINRHGLRLTGQAEFTSDIEASTDPSDFPTCDYGIVATKSIHTEAAIEDTQEVFDGDSAVCSVQNGLGNEEIIARYVKYAIRGTTFPAGSVPEPGHVEFEIEGDTWMGPYEPTETPMEKVTELADAVTRGGMNTIAEEDARGSQWSKLIFNASTNPVGALTRLHHAAGTYFEPTGDLFELLIREGEAVAHELGIELDGDPRDLVRQGAEAPGEHKSSMLQDVLAERETEVDFMNGAIVEKGEEAGVETPYNRAMWCLIKGIEHSWTDP